MNEPGCSKDYEEAGCSTDYERPRYSKDYDKPGCSKNYNKPGYNKDYERPRYNNDYNKPGCSKDYNEPGCSKDYERPRYNKAYDKPNYSKNYNEPGCSRDYKESSYNSRRYDKPVSRHQVKNNEIIPTPVVEIPAIIAKFFKMELKDMERRKERYENIDDIGRVSAEMQYGSDECVGVEIFKLNADCFEEIFTHLEINDLYEIRGVCIRFRNLVDWFIREYYPDEQYDIEEYIVNNEYLDPIDYTNYRELDESKKKMLKQLRIRAEEVTGLDLNIFSNSYNQIKRIIIEPRCIFNGDFSEVLGRFRRLQSLKIRSNFKNNPIIGKTNGWMYYRYPLLNYLELKEHYGHMEYKYENTLAPTLISPDLRQLFICNRNIRTFSTTYNLLWMNRECWWNSGISFEHLHVLCDFQMSKGAHSIRQYLNELYDEQFYKYLTLRIFNSYEQNDINHIALMQGLDKLHLEYIDDNVIIPIIPELRELAINRHCNLEAIEYLAKNSTNLKHVHLGLCKSDTILHFLRYTRSLKTMKLDSLANSLFFEQSFINLYALNEIRKFMPDNGKVILYLPERLVVTTKWLTDKLEGSHIEVRRTEEYHSDLLASTIY